jgi:hypothetical protein
MVKQAMGRLSEETLLIKVNLLSNALLFLSVWQVGKYLNVIRVA